MDFYSSTGKSDSYFRGLNVRQADSGLYAVSIGTGFFKPGEQKITKWDPQYTYLNIDPSTSIEITRNKESLPRFDYIVAKPDYTKRFGAFRGLRFYAKPGELRSSVDETIVPEFPDNLSEDEILLGVIYNPTQGSPESSSISIISVNNTENTFAYETQPSDLRKHMIYSLQEWKTGTFYIKQQVINHALRLWYCKSTHTSGNFYDDIDWYWSPISGTGEGGTGGLSEVEVISIIDNYVNPGGPQHSLQFNSNLSSFGGSENLLWLNSANELFLNGVLVLKSLNSPVTTPSTGEAKLYFEEAGEYLYLKVKIQNGKEYIISSFKTS